jgi:hypothetical protein
MEIDAGAGIDRWMDFLRFLEIDQLLNLAEAILWLSISGIFAFRLRRTKTNRDLSITCIIAFALVPAGFTIRSQSRLRFSVCFGVCPLSQTPAEVASNHLTAGRTGLTLRLRRATALAAGERCGGLSQPVGGR